MIRIKPLSDQFESDTVDKIRRLQNRLNEYPILSGAGIRYAKEIVLSLEAGLLLSSASLSSTLLEIFFRDLLLYLHLNQSENDTDNVLRKADFEEIRLEDSTKPQYSFRRILNKVSGLLDIDKELYNETINFYDDIRIPLHHGLTRRFLREERIDYPSVVDEPDLFPLIGSISIRFHEFDERIEEDALNIVDRVISIIESVVTKLES